MNYADPLSTAVPARSTAGHHWRVSLPMMLGAFTYLASLQHGLLRNFLLRDGDTTWHIATGRWVLEHRAVPDADPFSHSRAGAPWTAHEWLSDVLLALAHDLAGFSGVVGLTALAFALTISILANALLKYVSPTRCILFCVLAMLLTSAHLLARPHILAMPLMLLWVGGLVRAVDGQRAPSFWLLPGLTVWANMHGGFTLGVALACALGMEAGWSAWKSRSTAAWLRSWGLFLALTLVFALITPHGLRGLLFTWQVMVEDRYALSRVGEWASPNFHEFQPMMLWLLGGLALVLTQGLRLPPMRLVLVLGLLYLSLKHVRNVELLGLLVPLLVAAPFSAQWSARSSAAGLQDPDRLQRWLARRPLRCGGAAIVVGLAFAVSIPWLAERARPLRPPEAVAPVQALKAARLAGVSGPVLNGYAFGGYLIHEGIPVHIDGRADMYREAHLREYLEALDMRQAGGLDALTTRYGITWTILSAGTPAVASLDRSSEWVRVYADDVAVVHRKVKP